MKQLLKEFKDFAFKSNVIDMAVGVIIATKFNAIVSSLVNLISSLIPAGELTFAETPTGMFCSAIVDFLVCAVILFIFIRVFNNAKKKFEKPVVEEKKEPVLSKEAELLTEIKELLKNK